MTQIYVINLMNKTGGQQKTLKKKSGCLIFFISSPDPAAFPGAVSAMSAIKQN